MTLLSYFEGKPCCAPFIEDRNRYYTHAVELRRELDKIPKWVRWVFGVRPHKFLG